MCVASRPERAWCQLVYVGLSHGTVTSVRKKLKNGAEFGSHIYTQNRGQRPQYSRSFLNALNRAVYLNLVLIR